MAKCAINTLMTCIIMGLTEEIPFMESGATMIL